MSWDSHATLARLNLATADLDPPFAIVDLAGFDSNRRDIARRAGGCTVRVASKSLRARWAVDEVLRHSQFSGVLAFTLREAMWLAKPSALGPGIDDVVVGYPTVDRHALRQLCQEPELLARVTLMIDDAAQLELIRDAAAATSATVKVCIDVDSSWRPHPRGLKLPVHVGARRSPLHDRDQVAAFAVQVIAAPNVKLEGLMFYEAQIAGVANEPPKRRMRGRAIRAMQAASGRELAQRRPLVVQAVNELLAQRTGRALRFVNAGGTGSLETSSADPSVSEVTAGSGFFAPTLFDGYRNFELTPAAMFALPVVRRPGPSTVTVLGGGYVASGIADPSRLPTPWLPAGLSLDSQEGAGEVQTPLHGGAAAHLAIGDRVWFRHAKAGELAERFNEFALIRGSEVVAHVPTYRGEGKAFL